MKTLLKFDIGLILATWMCSVPVYADSYSHNDSYSHTVKLATNAEADGLTRTDVAVTPANLGSVISGGTVLGSMARQNSPSVSITGGNILGLTDFFTAAGDATAFSVTTLKLGAGATTVTAFGISLIGGANAAAGRSTLGLGTIATQNASAVTIGSLTATTVNGYTPTTFGLSMLGDANATAGRLTLGLGTAATQNVGTFFQTANNLSEVITPTTARSNLGLGNMATQNKNAVDITGGNEIGLTKVITAAATATALTVGTSPVSAFVQTVLPAADGPTALTTLGAEPRVNNANAWYVDKTGNDTTGTGKTRGLAYLTIGKAVLSAASGDVIFVGPGTYAETITSAKNLTFWGPGAIISGSFSLSNCTSQVLFSGMTVPANSSGFTLTAADYLYGDMGAVTFAGDSGKLISSPGTNTFLLTATSGITASHNSCTIVANSGAGTGFVKSPLFISSGTGNTVMSIAGTGFTGDAEIGIVVDTGTLTLVSGSPVGTSSFTGRFSSLSNVAVMSNINANITATTFSSIATGALAQNGAGRVTWNSSTYPGTVTVALKAAADNTLATTGTGKVKYTFPYPGTWEMAAAGASVYSASASATKTDVNWYSLTNSHTFHTTNITIDSGALTSISASVPTVIDSSHCTITQGDEIEVNVNAVAATSLGLEAWARFRRVHP